MKRFLIGLALIAGLFSLTYAAVGDYFTVTDEAGTDLMRITADKDLLFTGDMDDIGSASDPISAINATEANISSYTYAFVQHDHWTNVPVVSTFGAYTVLIASGSIYLTNTVIGQDNLTTNIARCPTNISVALAYDAANTVALASSFTISGITAQGSTVNEVVNVLAPKTVYYTKNAFISISSVTYALSSPITTGGATDCRVNVGFGPKIGLTGDIYDDGDLIAALEDAGVVANIGASRGGIDTVYDTYDPVTDSDGTNFYDIIYKVRKMQ